MLSFSLVIVCRLQKTYANGCFECLIKTPPDISLIFQVLPAVIKCQTMLSFETGNIGHVYVASRLYIIETHNVI
jgi:hypothetical protein